jgi:hypothetical protein
MGAAFKPFRVPKDTKNRGMIENVINGWRNHMGTRPGLFSEDVQRAMVAAEVMSCMRSAADIEEINGRAVSATVYTEVYEQALKILGINDLD